MKNLHNINRPSWTDLEPRADKIRAGYFALDRNENADLIYREQLSDIITNEIDLTKASQYEDYFHYYTTLSDHYGVSTKNMLITGGCDEAIRLTFEALLTNDTTYLSISPTYRGAETNAIDLVDSIHTCGEDEATIIEYFDHINPEVFYICSPNNPSGKVYSREFIEALLKDYPDTVIFIDNTYADFCSQDYVDLIKYKNCLIGRSYSKAWGLAGARMGLLLGHSALIQQITKIRPIMSVSSITLQVVNYLHKNISIVEDTIKRNREGIDYIYNHFKDCTIYSEPNVNHIIFDAPAEFIELLDKNKYLYATIHPGRIRLTTLPVAQFKAIYDV